LNKVFNSAEEAIWDVRDGASIIFGGIGSPHTSPSTLIQAVKNKKVRNLTAICELPGFGPTNPVTLADDKQIKKLIACWGGVAGFPTAIEKQIASGEVEFEMVSMGLLCERLRAGGAGIPAFYSPTGVGTITETGKEKRTFGGREYLLETSLKADFAFITAHKADTLGNLVFRGTSRNFNPVFATAAKITIAEVEEIVDAGEIDPNQVVTPGIYVDRIIKTKLDRRAIGFAALSAIGVRRQVMGEPIHRPGMKPSLSRDLIAMRIAKEFKDGQWINLGVGIPSLVSQFIPQNIQLHAEMGILAFGPIAKTEEEIDVDIFGASAEYLTLKPGTSFCSILEAFAMARGGRLNTVVLGAFQVSEKGDIANILTPEMKAPGVGGAMDLVTGSSKVIVAMEHIREDGKPKIVKNCTYALTGQRCVSLIVTDLAFIEVTNQGLLLKEVAPGWSPAEVQALTDAPLIISSDCKEISF
jgi:3-oxoacid CoA-transferase